MPIVTPAPPSPERSDVHVDVQVEAAVDGDTLPEVGSVGDGTCAQASLEVVGETRSGRALGRALVQVSARPWVDIYVDGVFRGRTPQIAVDLLAGPRDLSFVRGDTAFACTFRVHAHAGARYAVSIDAEAAAP